jgi:hypothetical protein
LVNGEGRRKKEEGRRKREEERGRQAVSRHLMIVSWVGLKC